MESGVVFLRRANPEAQAHHWVEERLRRLLEGKVTSVIRGIRYQATQYGLKGQRKKTVTEAADYFERNRDRMKYDEYLAAGYPIGSGVVEGACRHLVKDRMERSGMRGSHQVPRQCWICERLTSTGSGTTFGNSTWSAKTNGSTAQYRGRDDVDPVVTPKSLGHLSPLALVVL